MPAGAASGRVDLDEPNWFGTDLKAEIGRSIRVANRLADPLMTARIEVKHPAVHRVRLRRQ